MNEQFDAYHAWLGIPRSEQPPNYYRLLGVPLFESNATVIANAADRQMGYVRAAATGQHVAIADKLLMELTAARNCLLDAAFKAAYDSGLRTIAQHAPSPAPPPVSTAPLPQAVHSSMASVVPETRQPTAATSVRATRRTVRRRQTRQQDPAVQFVMIVIGGIAGTILGLVFLGVVYRRGPFAMLSQPKQASEIVTNIPRRKTELPKPSTGRTHPIPATSLGHDRPPISGPKSAAAEVPKASEVPKEAPPTGSSGPKPVDDGTLELELEFGAKDARRPVPNADEKKNKRELVKELLSPEFDAATTTEGEKKLTQALQAQVAKRRDEPAVQYVLLEELKRIAIEMKDALLLESVEQKIIADFKVDSTNVRLELLTTVAEWANTSVKKRAVAASAVSLVFVSLRDEHQDINGRVENAEKAIELAIKLAKELKDEDFLSTNAKGQKALELCKRARDARITLVSDPNDPRANLIFGIYLCAFKGNWGDGLARLARGANEELAKLAARDLDGPKTPEEQRQLADDWCEAAKRDKDLAFLFVRGQHWYVIAIASLDGITRDLAERRLDELRALVPESIASAYVPLAEAFEVAPDEDVIVLAYRQVAVKEFEPACRILMQAVKSDPGNLRPEFEAGLIRALAIGDLGTAIRHFDNCVSQPELAPAARNNLAICKIRLHRDREALPHFRALLASTSPLEEAMHNVCRLAKFIESGRITAPTSRRSEVQELRERAEKLSSSGAVTNWQGWVFVSLTADFEPLTGLSLVDTRCLMCDGRKLTKCPSPACQGGRVKTPGPPQVVGRDPITGATITRSTYTWSDCPVCSGGHVSCRSCGGTGIERGL